MNRSRHLVVVFCLSVFGGSMPAIAAAQSSAAVAASPSLHGTSQPASAAAAGEIAFTGTIQEVVSKNAPGTPPGLRLEMAGPQGLVTAHMGPYLTNDIKASLATGQSVQLTGVNQTLNGQTYLFVRQMTIGARQVIVRNENGILVRPRNVQGSLNRQNQSVTKGENQ